METKEITGIDNIAGGAVIDLVKEALPEVLQNVGDENTKWSTPRGIDIHIRFKVNSEARESMTTTVKIDKVLASPKEAETTDFLQFDGNQVSAYAMDNGKQLELDDSVLSFAKEASKQ